MNPKFRVNCKKFWDGADLRETIHTGSNGNIYLEVKFLRISDVDSVQIVESLIAQGREDMTCLFKKLMRMVIYFVWVNRIGVFGEE